MKQLGCSHDVIEEAGLVGASTKTDIGYDTAESWQFGLIVKTKELPVGKFKNLHDLVKPEINEIAWLGYTNGETAADSEPSVWFYCASSQFDILTKRLKTSGLVSSKILTGEADGSSYLSVSATTKDIESAGGDKEWFKSIFASVLKT